MSGPLEISASGLVAQRLRLDTIAGNIANFSTTRDADGKPNPFVRRMVVFEAAEEQGAPAGVRVAKVDLDDPKRPGAEPFRLRYEPGNPDADRDGYVRYPNIDLTREIVNAMEASRAYEANIQAMEAAKQMSNQVNRLIE
jgi:flagellar basal-body rod protein FlgC